MVNGGADIRMPHHPTLHPPLPLPRTHRRFHFFSLANRNKGDTPIVLCRLLHTRLSSNRLSRYPVRGQITNRLWNTRVSGWSALGSFDLTLQEKKNSLRPQRHHSPLINKPFLAGRCHHRQDGQVSLAKMPSLVPMSAVASRCSLELATALPPPVTPPGVKVAMVPTTMLTAVPTTASRLTRSVP